MLIEKNFVVQRLIRDRKLLRRGAYTFATRGLDRYAAPYENLVRVLTDPEPHSGPAHMKARLRGHTGMSLVEATIILMVLALLTAVLAPAINQYVDDARETQATEDVEAIGVAIARLLRDTGYPFLIVAKSGSLANQFTKTFRVDLLLSNGNKPTAGANVNTATTNTSNISTSPLSWSSDLNGNTIASMYDHLVTNEGLDAADDGYRHPADTLDTVDPSVPQSLGAFGHGWRGAYVSGIPGPDPWGYRYMVNSVYLGAATDATTSGEGRAGTGWSFDTFVVSAGRNNTVETDFEATTLKGTSFATGGSVGNDDLLYVISGFGK